jgi:chemotaxis signal transduction protein
MPARPESVPGDIVGLLERRAARLRAPVAVEPDAVLWVAEISVGERVHVLPLAALRATVPLRMVTPVPLAPPHVIGILRFHGQIITALSLASLLGVAGWRADPAVLVIVEVGGEVLCAIDCEQVPKAAPISARAIDLARARAPGSRTFEVHAGDRWVHFVEPARLLDAPPRGHRP